MPVLAADIPQTQAAPILAASGFNLAAGGIEDSAFAALLDGLIPGLTGDAGPAGTDPSALLPQQTPTAAPVPTNIAASAPAPDAPQTPLPLTLDFTAAVQAALAGGSDKDAVKSQVGTDTPDTAAAPAKPADTNTTSTADPALLLAGLIMPTPPQQNPTPPKLAALPAAPDTAQPAQDAAPAPQAAPASKPVQASVPSNTAPAPSDPATATPVVADPANASDAAAAAPPTAKPGKADGAQAKSDSKAPAQSKDDKDKTTDDAQAAVAQPVPAPVLPPVVAQIVAAQTPQPSAASDAAAPLAAVAGTTKPAAAPTPSAPKSDPAKPQAAASDDDSDDAAPADKPAQPFAPFQPQAPNNDKTLAAKTQPHLTVAAQNDNASAPAPDAAQASASDQATPQPAAPAQPQAAPQLPIAIAGLVAPSHAAQPSQTGQPAAAPTVGTHVHVAHESPTPNMGALAVSIAARSQSGARQFDIRLDPPELGRVDVRLSIDATGKASAHMTAEQPQTLDLLQKDSASLTRALRDAGLDVSQSGLNFSLKGQDRQSGDGQASRPRVPAQMLTATKTIDAVQTTASYRSSAGDARLDIQV